MLGYFVITKDASDEQSEQLKKALQASGLVNLQCTRTFNRVTEHAYEKPVVSAITRIRNNQEEQRRKRKEYHSRPEVKQRMKEYNQDPKVKERKRLDRQRRQKLLSLVPKEAIAQLYKAEENKPTE